MEFAQARANYLLDRAAGKRVYRFLVVLTAEQEAAHTWATERETTGESKSGVSQSKGNV